MSCPFGDMAILVVFWRFLWTKMAKLSPIDFKISLPTDVNVNEGQNKFEVDISKHEAKIFHLLSQNRPTATLACTFSCGKRQIILKFSHLPHLKVGYDD